MRGPHTSPRPRPSGTAPVVRHYTAQVVRFCSALDREGIPLNVLRFIAAQLGMRAEDLDGYVVREETRREHLAGIRRIYGYRMFSGRCARERGGSGAFE